ncbi:MAG: T9SS type A sorting domain-containing protein [Bacteroidota bacterium]
MKKIIKYTAVLFLVLTASVTFGQPTIPETFKYANSAIPTVNSWWNNWPRFTYYTSDLMKVLGTNANTMTVVHGMQDEGRAPFFRDYVLAYEKVNTVQIQNQDVKIMAWLEGMGEAREFLIAVHELADGTYEQDALTGQSKLIASPWTWDSRGPGVNPDANTVKWAGMASYVNDPDWVKPKGIPGDIELPTYPDGSSALGYALNDESDPRNAFLYDAIGCKDINGALALSAASISSSNQTGKVDYTVPGPGGATFKADDMSIKKDMASPWWVGYNIRSAEYFITQHNIDGFWIDNYTGWDFMGSVPLDMAFGEWSVSSFRDYLLENPVEGETHSEDYDVRDALKARFLTYFPSGNPEDLKSHTTRGYWNQDLWMDDPLWSTYKCHKAKTGNRNMIRLYEGIKEVAEGAGKDPENILVSGNDLPGINFGSFKGLSLDIASTEYSPVYNRSTHGYSDGIPPHGNTTPFYAITTSFTKSHIGSVWYYLDGEYAKYQGNPTLGELLGYEALTGNISLNLGKQQPMFPGDDASALNVNTTIEKMAPLFGQREREGEVGLYYSTDSEYLYITPNGTAKNARIPAITGYYGWGTALERLHIQYRAIPDFKLTEAYLDGLSVLILPNVESIDPVKIEQVIVPFVENGGSVIISGKNAGRYQGIKQNFTKNDSPLLYDLTLNKPTNGNVLFIKEEADTEFYIYHLDRTWSYGANELAVLKESIDSLVNMGALARQTELVGFNEGKVRAIMHADRSEERWFVDLLNTNINLTYDIITPSEGGTLILTLPEELVRTPTYSFYDTDVEKPYKLEAETMADGRVELTIPGFRMYGSLVIDGELGAGVPEVTSPSNVELSLFPNPAADVIEVVAAHEILNIKIYTISGKLMYQDNLKNRKRVSIDIEKFGEAIYILQIATHQGISTKRFIVM